MVCKMIILVNLFWLFVAFGVTLELPEQSSYQSESPETCLVRFSENRPDFQCFSYNEEPDIKMLIGRQLIRAHLRFVRQSIPYFDVPDSDIKSRINSIEKQNLDPVAVKDIFSFVYTQQLIIDDENVLQLLRAAHFMKMDNIAQTCIDFVIMRINERNVIVLLNFSALHYIWALWIPAEGYTLQNFAKVSTTKEFLELNSDAFLVILRSNEIRNPSEEHVYEATKRWIDHKPTERSDLSFQVYEHIRFPLMKPDYFYQTVVPTLSSNAQLQGFLTEYDEYHNKGKQSKVEGCRTWPRTGTTKVLVLSERDIDFNLQFFYPMTNISKLITTKVKLTDIFSCVELNCNLYIIGAKKRLQDNVDNTYIYNPKSDSLRIRKTMNVYRKWYASAVLNGIIYVTGGQDIKKNWLSSVESFNPFTDTWTPNGQLSSMLVTRSQHRLVAYDGHLYAIGGRNNKYYHSSVEKYDVKANKWTLVKPMLQARFHFGSAVLNGKLYVCGGQTSDKRYDADAEVFDRLTQTWTQIKKMPQTRRRFSMLAYMGKLWAFSGDNHIKNQWINVYDPDTDSWTVSTKLAKYNPSESFLMNF